MAEESKPAFHVDSDWKKQAQEEKRKLAEQDAARKKQAEATAATPMGVVAGSGARAGQAQGGQAAPGQRGQPASSGQSARPGTGQAGRRPEMPVAGLDTLVQSLVTQVLYYVGDMAPRGGEPVVNLDMAKHNLDTLAVLEAKTKGNLTPEEQHMIDAATYEARMRFIAVSNRYAELV